MPALVSHPVGNVLFGAIDGLAPETESLEGSQFSALQSMVSDSAGGALPDCPVFAGCDGRNPSSPACANDAPAQTQSALATSAALRAA